MYGVFPALAFHPSNQVPFLCSSLELPSSYIVQSMVPAGQKCAACSPIQREASFLPFLSVERGAIAWDLSCGMTFSWVLKISFKSGPFLSLWSESHSKYFRELFPGSDRQWMWREHKFKTIYYHRGCGGGVCREIGVKPRYMLLLGYSFEAGLQSKFLLSFKREFTWFWSLCCWRSWRNQFFHLLLSAPWVCMVMLLIIKTDGLGDWSLSKGLAMQARALQNPR